MRRALAIAVLACLALPGSASAFTVNVIGDGPADACDSSCTLRDAMTLANSTPGADLIDFAIPGAGTHQISPGSALPSIDEQVSINGTTQPGWTQDALVIEIDGAVAGPGANGLFVNNAANVNIQGLAINNFDGAGILTSAGSTGATIIGNFIGTGFDGTSAGSGNDGNGIDLDGSGHAVGNGLASGRNVIGGNGTLSSGTHGIKVSGNTNTIEGNHIGVDRIGTSTIPNIGSGIDLADEGNTVGGNGSGEGNVISGNTEDGILIEGSDSNTIRGNRIGTDAAGATDLGNSGHGINIQSSIGSDDNQIGGLAVGEGNVISGNGANGIWMAGPSIDNNNIIGNRIGTGTSTAVDLGNGFNGIDIANASTTLIEQNTIAFNDFVGVKVVAGTGNRITANAMRDNGELGVYLRNDPLITPTPNDLGDPDVFGNNRQNYPVISSVTVNGSAATITATLNSTPNTNFQLQGFKNGSCDPSGNGEGGAYLGFTTVTTDASGNATIQTGLPGVALGDVITATAIATISGDTSEFSACETAVAAPPPPPPTTFTPPEAGAAQEPAPLPPPVAGKQVNVGEVSGTVRIKEPGGSFRILDGREPIRTGSVIDTTKGRVRLTSAAGRGKTQTADFYDGVFKVVQSRGKLPITELRLVGKLAGCKKASTAARKRKGRRLWGKGKGRFRTRGKRSSALVRGTTWLVEDRCDDTTLTVVRAGRVEVRDFRRKRSKIVRAGRRYVAH